MFAEVWSKLQEPLMRAETEAAVIAAIEAYGQPYEHEFVPRFASDILSVIREPKFPKRSVPQTKFLADSLAGRPNVSLRTSRDILSKQARIQNEITPSRIIRKEYYVECSCGYKGPALNDACRKCGAQISYLEEILANP
jgi:hypothetical protein